MKMIKNILVVVVLLAMVCSPMGVIAGDEDSGTFRGKFWNYYDRGLSSAEKGDLAGALNDLKQAAAKRGLDQRMARTYGMHFIDYFPHREIGIIYFNQGDLAKATAELEESIKGEESAKAAFYLNKVRQQTLQKQGAKFAPPAVIVAAPASVRTSSLVIKGTAAGDGYVSRVSVNGLPVRFDLAKKSMEFSQEVALEDGMNEITVLAEDLLGAVSKKTVTVMVDREGPAVNIFDIVEEDQAGKPFVRITGEISDATGINKMVVNNETIAGNGAKTYAVNLLLERGKAGKFAIVANDALGNETKADVDVERDLVAFNQPMEPYMLAFNATRALGIDKRPPVVELKEVEELPTVFIDKYYVEGDVFDNRKVDRILVNNKEISTKQGKKIFFSRIVNLKEGKNKINVEAYDTSDNKSIRTFGITRKIPPALQTGSRMSVTILPFDSNLESSDRIQLAYEQLISAFVDQKRFSVIERSKLEQVLIEQKLTKAKLTDPEHSIKLGKLMSADAILAATVNENKKSIEIIARVISTETSEVIESKDMFAEDKSLSTVKELMAGLALKFAASFPVAEAMVIKVSGKDIYADLGDKSHVKKNMAVLFYRKGEEIKHPITGKSLGFDIVKLGEGRVNEVESDYTKITLMDKPVPKEILVKDMMVTK